MKAKFYLGGIEVEVESYDEFKEVSEKAGDILEQSMTFQQLAIAKGVFDPTKSSTPAAVAAKPQSGPPADDAPRCKHGPMNDLGDKGYKHRWYCSGPKGDQKDKGCWAKD